MKEINNGFVILLTGLLLVASPVLSMSGGDYEIRRSTIDGGGGQSSGGDFVLVGTIGQADAGEMSGGDYSLSGGFWPRGTLVSCFVNFEDFALFAMFWLDAPCNAGNNFCGGSDLDFSGDVTITDLNEVVYFWLDYCPEDWPWD